MTCTLSSWSSNIDQILQMHLLLQVEVLEHLSVKKWSMRYHQHSPNLSNISLCYNGERIGLGGEGGVGLWELEQSGL